MNECLNGKINAFAGKLLHLNKWNGEGIQNVAGRILEMPTQGGDLCKRRSLLFYLLMPYTHIGLDRVASGQRA